MLMLALVSMGLVYMACRRAISLWIDDLQPCAQYSAHKFGISDGVASGIHFFGSIVIFIASLAISAMY